MPNHVSNIIQLKALDSEEDWRKEEEALEAMKALMKTETHPFDFNVLIPYPEQYKALDDARHEAEKQPGMTWQNLPKDGYNQGGYEWCVEHWGTKWNAYDIGFTSEGVAFQTAWATPKPIFVELSKRFPDLLLEVEFADEDRGNNCGKLVYKNGKLVEFVDMSDRPDSELFARAIIAEQGEAHTYMELAELREKVKAQTPTSFS